MIDSLMLVFYLVVIIWVFYTSYCEHVNDRKKRIEEFYNDIKIYNSLVKAKFSVDTTLKDTAKARLKHYIDVSEENVCEWRKRATLSGNVDKIRKSDNLLLKRDTILAKLKSDEEIPEEVYAESYFDVNTKTVY